MALTAGIIAAVLIVGAYWLGLYRGFGRGYLAGLFDAALAEEVQDDSGIGEDAYLAVFGDRIDAGRKGRN